VKPPIVSAKKSLSKLMADTKREPVVYVDQGRKNMQEPQTEMGWKVKNRTLFIEGRDNELGKGRLMVDGAYLRWPKR